MKIKPIKLLSLLLFLGGISACTQEEVLNESGTIQEVSFTFNLGGDPTSKTDDSDVPEFEFPEECKSFSDLQDLANDGKLKANISFSTSSIPGSSDPIMTLAIKNIGENSLQTLAYPLTLGTYWIHAVTITDNENNILYSGVKHGSTYSNYIQEGKHMSEVKIVLTDDHKFRKTHFDLHVLCANKITPADFGFVKWNVNFTKVYCIPFLVDICDEEKGDISANGYFKVEYKDSEGNYSVLKEEIFNSSGNYSEICFKDDYSIPNDIEYHKITLIVGTKKYEKEVNVIELLKYQSHKSWDKDLKYLHINFCDCSQVWIFDCEGEDNPEPPTPPTSCVEELRFIEGNSNTGGSDALLEFWTYKTDSNGNFVGDGDNNKYEFEDFVFHGINVLSFYDANNGNGVFSLKKGLACRSIDAVPYKIKKIMKIQLDIIAPAPAQYKEKQDICRIVIFDASGKTLGSFPYMGWINSPNANNESFHFDELDLKDENGNKVTLNPNECYRVGILTYIDAPWEINVKQFFVRTEGN